jgi:TorA maturation chaperone TorD
MMQEHPAVTTGETSCKAVCAGTMELPGVDVLLADASLLRGLSVALRPPAPDLPRRLVALAGGLPAEAAAALEALAGLATPELESHYHATLGPGGVCPTGESDYSMAAAMSKGTLLGDVCGFYAAFGFDPSRELHDAPDHVAIELAFGSYLLTKTAYAIHAGRCEQAHVAFEAWLGFRADHLDPWVGALCDRIEERAPCEFYRLAGRLLRHAIVVSVEREDACRAATSGP